MEAPTPEISHEHATPATPTSERRGQPLSREQRRVLGVLIEKSKTTPDVYPMTINGIKTGCNQKSNRSPLMELDEHRVEDILYELRQLGCVVEVHSGGRVPKYKHQAYDWLSVTKAELSVITELLLRGEQSVGDLRARSARMETTIETLEDLRPILSSLREKGLLVELTPAGRGQIVTHRLYLENELERLHQHYRSHGPAQSEVEPSDDSGETASSSAIQKFGSGSAGRESAASSSFQQRLEDAESAIRILQAQIAELKRLIET